MSRSMTRWSWLVVAAVGLFVVVLVFALNLFGRLNAAQEVLGGLQPAFNAERVAGDRAAINEISIVVDTLDPLMTREGGASADVPKLVEFVSQKSGLTLPQVLGALQENFPHTTGLLTALPLSDVSAEIPQLVEFLSTTLKLSPDQVMAALQQNFPKLAQVITNLPKTTEGWNNVPGAELTRFDGTVIKTVPQIRDYFNTDVIPVVERQQGHFRALDSRGGVGFLAPLLLILGVIVMLFGLAMAVLAPGLPKEMNSAGWLVVTVVGVVVVVLVLGLNLFGRLSGGDDLLGAAGPAFTAERVAGHASAIDMVETVTDTFDPAATPEGGGADEVPKLLAFVSKTSGLSPEQVAGALQENFPKTLGLLSALPLTEVTAEVPKLVAFLATTLNVTPEAVNAVFTDTVPRLGQSVANLPQVTSGWNNIPGAQDLTRFGGEPVKSVPQAAAYFKQDVIPAIDAQSANFRKVDTTWPPLTVFAPLLLIVGIIVFIYGLAMLFLTRPSRS